MLKEQLQYLDYLEKARELEGRMVAEREKLVLEDLQEQNDKTLRLRKLDAAARRRLLCEVKEVQKHQREEKGKTRSLLTPGLREPFT